tara:strand:- start:16122 stop:16877 length:756 start_codon:yes stop_codon:yes gene_type:complete
MSWFDESFTYRYPIAIENTGATANYDISIVIPSQWDTFWENIASNGYDIIPVSPSGNLIAFQRNSFNYANRTLTLQLDAYELITASVNFIYIYFKKTGAADQATVITFGSPKDGQIWLGKPANMIVGPSSFVGGASSPAQTFVMNTSTSGYIWFSTQNLLAKRFSPYNERMSYEEIHYCKVQVLDNGGSAIPGMVDQNKTRFIPGFIGAYIQGGGGSDGSNYQAKVTIQTVQGSQTFALTATIQLRNQLPS